jgi:hypothetical protein
MTRILNFVGLFVCGADETLLETRLPGAGTGPVSRQRAIMLLGGFHQLAGVTIQDGGRLDDITEEAVDSSIALLTPGT